jgi:hypothetical protein
MQAARTFHEWRSSEMATADRWTESPIIIHSGRSVLGASLLFGVVKPCRYSRKNKSFNQDSRGRNRG